MEWTVRVEMTGAPTEEQQEALVTADDGPYLVKVDAGIFAVEMLMSVAADSATAALGRAKRALERLAPFRDLVAAGVLTDPHRVVVEGPHAPSGELDVIATKALAGLLGVSEQRVRELAGKGRPDFPTPHRIDGAAGMYFRRSEAEAYARRRKADGDRA